MGEKEVVNRYVDELTDGKLFAHILRTRIPTKVLFSSKACSCINVPEPVSVPTCYLLPVPGPVPVISPEGNNTTLFARKLIQKTKRISILIPLHFSQHNFRSCNFPTIVGLHRCTKCIFIPSSLSLINSFTSFKSF